MYVLYFTFIFSCGTVKIIEISQYLKEVQYS